MSKTVKSVSLSQEAISIIEAKAKKEKRSFSQIIELLILEK